MAARLQASATSSLSALPPHLSRRSAFPFHRTSLPFRRFSILLRPLLPTRRRRLRFSYAAEDLCSESPLRIVEYPDPILRARNKRINSFDENLKRLVEEMFDVMYKTDGIGLSAPQVGINVKLMVFNPAGERGEGEETVLVNPVLYKASKRTLFFDEGCLSFPGIYADVEVRVTVINFMRC